jgi:hypothetical protein
MIDYTILQECTQEGIKRRDGMEGMGYRSMPDHSYGIALTRLPSPRKYIKNHATFHISTYCNVLVNFCNFLIPPLKIPDCHWPAACKASIFKTTQFHATL